MVERRPIRVEGWNKFENQVTGLADEWKNVVLRKMIAWGCFKGMPMTPKGRKVNCRMSFLDIGPLIVHYLTDIVILIGQDDDDDDEDDGDDDDCDNGVR